MNQTVKKRFEITRLHICDQSHTNWYEYIYSCFYPFSPHIDKHMFDIYSLTHLFWPMLLMLISNAVFGKNIKFAIFIIFFTTIFEIHENMENQIRKYHRIEVDSQGNSNYKGDSTINIIGDIIFNIIGVFLAYALSGDMSVVVLTMAFIIITYTVGFVYWTDFIKFLFLP